MGPLRKKLEAIRNEAIRRGMRLLSADEILEEVTRRRSGTDDGNRDRQDKEQAHVPESDR